MEGCHYRKTSFGKSASWGSLSPADHLISWVYRVDPDKIAQLLPERQQYLDFDKDNASERLHPEASMLQELLGLIARETRHSLVVDGSLSDGE